MNCLHWTWHIPSGRRDHGNFHSPLMWRTPDLANRLGSFFSWRFQRIPRFVFFVVLLLMWRGQKTTEIHPAISVTYFSAQGNFKSFSLSVGVLSHAFGRNWIGLHWPLDKGSVYLSDCRGRTVCGSYLGSRRLGFCADLWTVLSQSVMCWYLCKDCS